jgi:23S rRNA (cytosine1962-C5)-methyltransferase
MTCPGKFGVLNSILEHEMIERLEKIPKPSSKRLAIFVNKSIEGKIRKGHPWVFDKSIKKISHDGKPGDLGVIFDHKRKFLAVGLFDPLSPIRLRILASRKPVLIDSDFFLSRISTAKEIRDILPQNTTGYRLVHGENDFLPGLVMDKYAEVIVIKLYTSAWIPYLNEVIKNLGKVIKFKTIILRLSRTVKNAGSYLYGLEDGEILVGTNIKTRWLFKENGLQFEVDPVSGHKTGFYLDQRDNRKKVEGLATGKQVLNLFSYTGGFSIYAANGGAEVVTSVDISKHALKAAERNFNYLVNKNPVCQCHHKTIAMNVFEFLIKSDYCEKKYDMVVIDPPAFAKNREEISSAISAYQRLTKQALNLLKTGGILVQSSCSSQIKGDSFFYSVLQAANQVGRPLIEISRTGHPIDHPIKFKEGEYLKCIFAIA